MIVLTIMSLVLAGSLGLIRWLRVAQREHYIPATVLRFIGRWWSLSPNPVIGILILGAGTMAISARSQLAALGVGLGGAISPVGLGLRGRTSPLVWTRRLKRVAAVSVSPLIAGGLWSVWSTSLVPVVVSAIGLPLWLVVSLAILEPVELRIGGRWVREAGARLKGSEARVVAITGSFGKTTTKNYISHVLGGDAHIVVSPASFNNRLGLARAINEHLGKDTEVFVAEMGTYGPGEIRELCSWIPPDIAVITGLGPVHLERMGSEERIAEAKAEILELAKVGVINIEHPVLANLAEAERPHREIVTVSTRDRGAHVFVDQSSGDVVLHGETIGCFSPLSALASNVGCAVAVAVALGFEPADVASRLANLPSVPHRRAVGRSEHGFTVIDDTFNANPAGAAAALSLLVELAGKRRVVVTPGMVELGPLQAELNQELGRRIGQVASDLVIVGRTNLRALRAGAMESGLDSVIVTGSRDEAVSWIRGQLGPGDAVLYENDLPDHYP